MKPRRLHSDTSLSITSGWEDIVTEWLSVNRNCEADYARDCRCATI